ncbi:MAG: hypothetical protein HYU28_03460 [Actinobacteria bacterium]|nr:hypothetical protein [Actinomycetota bacterium]
MRRGWRLVALAGLITLTAAACGGGDGDGDGELARADRDAGAEANPNSGLVGGSAEFDIDAVSWNSYWYSRYNLGNLVMMSGLGVTFMPAMEDVQAMAAAVDQGPEAGEHVTLPENPALLKAVFAGGNPEFATAFNGNPGDFTNWRWDPTGTDDRITPSAMAQTITKEVEWAKLFNNAAWAGSPTDDFGAMDRFKGMALFAEAKMQATFALDMLRNADGFFVALARPEGEGVTVEDDSIDVADQYQMLQALADVRTVLDHPDAFNNVYGDEQAKAMIGAAADELFTLVAELEPKTVSELSLGAQAMTWFAAATGDDGLRAQARTELRSLGDALVGARRDGVVERAVAIRGLVESGRVLGEEKHLDAAAADFEAIQDAYDPATGSFDGVTELSNWEVGDVLGALNTLRVNAAEVVDKADVERMLVGFFEAVVNRGGLMRAAPPKEMEASPFEIERMDDAHFAYQGIPTPDKAGGKYGTAAVDAASVRFDAESGRWKVADKGFDTAGSMHASNEQIWTFGFVDGYPDPS